jgi:hypothetical protein
VSDVFCRNQKIEHNCRTALIACSLVLLAARLIHAAPDDVEPPKQDVQLQVQMFQMDEANFDANVFQPTGNAKQARSQMETKLKLQLDEIHRVCELSESQKQKLKLAASSDVKRFFDEVAVLRKKVAGGKLDQNAWNNIWQEIQPLRNRQAAGLFGDNSFFAKTVKKTLTEEQLAKYEAVVNERRRFRYLASIEVVMTNLESSVPLHRSQHETIVKLLMEKTAAPSAFGQYDQYLVMYQLTTLESKLKPLLEEHQWKQMHAQFDQYRGMEQFLIQNGLLPKEDGAVKVLKARVKHLVVQGQPEDDLAKPANEKPAENPEQ